MPGLSWWPKDWTPLLTAAAAAAGGVMTENGGGGDDENDASRLRALRLIAVAAEVGTCDRCVRHLMTSHYIL